MDLSTTVGWVHVPTTYYAPVVEIPSVGSGSFEFYEGLRVLLPGTFVVALYGAVGTTFGFLSDPGAIGAFPAIVGILVSGMLFLFLDIPSRAAVFAYESPLLVLESWDRRPPKGSNHLNVYYEILDTLVPGGIRTRTYYLGVIYRIGFEAVYMLALPALTALTLGELYPKVGKAKHLDVHASRLILLFAGVAILATFFAALAERYKQQARKDTNGRAARLKRVFEEIGREVRWPDRILLVAAIACATGYGLQVWSRSFAVAAVVTAAAVWGVRYFHGIPRSDQGVDPRTGTKLPPRQNLHGVSASLLFTVAALTAIGCALRDLPTLGSISTAACIGWSGSLVAAAALIQFRSHEKKLLGSYGLQRAWLLRNREKIESDYYGAQEPADSVDSARPNPGIS